MKCFKRIATHTWQKQKSKSATAMILLYDIPNESYDTSLLLGVSRYFINKNNIIIYRVH